MAPHLFGGLSIGIGAFAAGKKAVAAKEAFAAGDRERHDNPIASLQIGDGAADLDHLAHGFMAEYVAALHRGNHAVIDVEVGTADCAGGHLDDGVATGLDFRIGDALAPNVMLAVPCKGFHSRSLRSLNVVGAQQTERPDQAPLGYLPLQPRPVLVSSCTRSPSMRAAMRKPSSLISCSHCGPDGAVSTGRLSWGRIQLGGVRPAAEVSAFQLSDRGPAKLPPPTISL